MVLDRLTGVYFDETVSTVETLDTEPDERLQFIVQTSSAIADLDDQLKYVSIDSFKTLVANKGLTKTTAFIEYVLNSIGHKNFYVYSIKTDTSAGWKRAVTISDRHAEIRKVIFYEESESAQANTITAKMTALASGCADCATVGSFRIAYVTPQATVDAAVADALEEDETASISSTVISTMTSMLATVRSGRVAVLFPDNAEKVMATICNHEYHEEVGSGRLYEALSTRTYTFSRAQLLTLRNLGVIVVRTLYEHGEWFHEIELGVTTSWAADAADGLLVARTIADELLNEVKIAVRPFVKETEDANNVKFVQTAVNNVIADFKDAGYVTSETKLTVKDEGNMCFSITGGIKPSRSVAIIDVVSTLS